MRNCNADDLSAVVAPEFSEIAIYLYQIRADFCKGVNKLSVLVEDTPASDPFSHNLFCFVSNRRDQIKVLYWQRTGFCLWLKRLEEELSEDQFRWLLFGLDLKHFKPHRPLNYRTAL